MLALFVIVLGLWFALSIIGGMLIGVAIREMGRGPRG